MKRFVLITRSLLLSYVRQPATVFWNLVFPLFLLVIYRLVFGSAIISGVDYITWVVPGVVALNILSFGMIGSSAFMTQMRENGVLRRLQATPAPPVLLFAAYIAVNVVMCLLQTAVMMLFALITFHWTTTLSGLVISLPMILIATIASVALGQCISSLVPRQSVALAVGQLLYFTQMFTTGLVLPFDMLPTWLQNITRFLPAYAIGDLVRSPLIAGNLGADTVRNLTVVALYTLAAGFLATRFFRWEQKV